MGRCAPSDSEHTTPRDANAPCTWWNSNYEFLTTGGGDAASPLDQHGFELEPWHLDGSRPGPVRLGPGRNQARSSLPRAWIRPDPGRAAVGLDLSRPAENRLGPGRAQAQNGPPRASTDPGLKRAALGLDRAQARSGPPRASMSPGPKWSASGLDMNCVPTGGGLRFPHHSWSCRHRRERDAPSNV